MRIKPSKSRNILGVKGKLTEHLFLHRKGNPYQKWQRHPSSAMGAGTLPPLRTQLRWNKSGRTSSET